MAILSAKEAARELGTDARNFRKFMRTILPKEEQPGQGNRYQIEQKELKKLKKQFDEWAKPKAKAATKKAADVVEEIEDEEVEELLDEEEEEPTEDDLLEALMFEDLDEE